MSKQYSFSGFGKEKDLFGGSLLKGNPKTARPLDSKLPIHLVLRADKSSLRLPQTFLMVNETVRRITKKHGVSVYKYSNNGNHIHLLIKIPQRRRWAAFIRELTGRIAQVAQSLSARQKSVTKFWKQRPFTRVIRGWGKAFTAVMDYVELNFLESEGVLNRKTSLTPREMRALWAAAEA